MCINVTTKTDPGSACEHSLVPASASISYCKMIVLTHPHPPPLSTFLPPPTFSLSCWRSDFTSSLVTQRSCSVVDNCFLRSAICSSRTTRHCSEDPSSSASCCDRALRDSGIWERQSESNRCLPFFDLSHHLVK